MTALTQRANTDAERCQTVIEQIEYICNDILGSPLFEPIRTGRWRKISGAMAGIEIETNYVRGQATIRIYAIDHLDKPYLTYKLTGSGTPESKLDYGQVMAILSE